METIVEIVNVNGVNIRVETGDGWWDYPCRCYQIERFYRLQYYKRGSREWRTLDGDYPATRRELDALVAAWSADIGEHWRSEIGEPEEVRGRIDGEALLELESTIPRFRQPGSSPNIAYGPGDRDYHAPAKGGYVTVLAPGMQTRAQIVEGHSREGRWTLHWNPHEHPTLADLLNTRSHWSAV